MRILLASLALALSGFANAATYDCEVSEVATEKVVGKMIVDSSSDDVQIVNLGKNHAAVCTGADATDFLRLFLCGYVAASTEVLQSLTGHQILLGEANDILAIAAAHEDARVILSQAKIPSLKKSYSTVCIATLK